MLRTFPAGDPRSARRADRRAAEERALTGRPVHVHFDAHDDAFAVVRTDADTP
ncbi:hypothetical protein [Streptomyces luteireticuli]|uniref:hypothetical protein n=1 Tax=Streptomyces luteireticuli TaxID=173858 RepID=UPI003557E124